ncbi:MAG: flavodoxin-dependent (E)-4-hydroxy-3-methylbut-2-enyl-diphosphate synthase, partial [Bacteroidota bacterium]|nr:flavodoxin-dependent (E)-4-hydroxy-3-methylbut-2-enyl-diphosphate synthase [Bacteroidota bacterium]
IRVSLTEPPEAEIPVAKKLADRYLTRPGHAEISSLSGSIAFPDTFDPYSHSRRVTREVLNTGGSQVPRVIAHLSGLESIHPLSLRNADYHYDAINDKWTTGEQGADYLYFGSKDPGFMLPGGARGILDYEAWKNLSDKQNKYPLIPLQDWREAQDIPSEAVFVLCGSEAIKEQDIAMFQRDKRLILVLSTGNAHAFADLRQRFFDFIRLNVINPVIILREYREEEETFLLHSATDIGGLLAEGLGDGVWINYLPRGETATAQSVKLVNRTAFNILQASRTRISKTEYISCPSCGRTLFDLQETTAMIRERTDHLKGIKIAIMGCIVNGPGEMADADYGYVGTGPGKITLYRGKEVVKRNIDSRKALDELIHLIREDGNWIEKSEPVTG